MKTKLIVLLALFFTPALSLASTIAPGNITSDTVWDSTGSPYLVSYLSINQGATLTVLQGTVVKFQDSNSMIDIYGTLVAEGEETNPIYFTSIKDDTVSGDTNGDGNATNPTPASWDNIIINPSGTATFNHSVIRYGGWAGPWTTTVTEGITNNGGTLSLQNSTVSFNGEVRHKSGNTNISHSLLSDNVNAGIIAHGSGTVSLLNNTFNNNPASGNFDMNGGLTLSNSGNTGEGTGIRGFVMDGMMNADQTWGKDGVAYVPLYLVIPIGRKLNVLPGAIVKFRWENSGMEVSGTLTANGTKDEPIYFTSLKDDIGNDTDGIFGTPSPKDWDKILINGTGTATFNHSIIRFGGWAGPWTPIIKANLSNSGGLLTLTNSQISHSDGDGILHRGGTTNISQSSIHDNSYGIFNATETPLSAENNWWGSPAGPYHSLLNMGGLGNNEVSNNVSFSPWLFADPMGEEAPCTENCYSNVMFLPGIMGSNLYDITGEKVWLSENDEEADILRMDETGESIRGDITTRDAMEEGGWRQATVNIYKSFISEMRDWETSYGITATTTPYDWRLDFDTTVSTGRKLSNGNISYLVPPAEGEDPYIVATLKQLAESSKTGKVTIIAHSQGGLITKALTKKLGADASKYIDKIIMVATPQLGTPEAFARILHGYKAGIIGLPGTTPSITDPEVRVLAKTMQSAFNLLPSEKYFTYVDDPIATLSTTTPSSWQAAYGNVIHWNQGMYNFISDSANVRINPAYTDLANPEISNPAFLLRAKTLHDEMDNWLPPLGVQFTTVAGWGMETLSGLEYYGKKDCELVDFDDAFKKVTVVCTDSPQVTIKPNKVIDGDGTVVEPSAHFANGQASTRYWVDLDRYNRFVPKKLRTDHKDILEVQELRTLFTNILTNGTTPFPDKYISTMAPAYNGATARLHFILHSPLTLEFYDTFGNHIGLSTTTGEIDYDIPGAEYERYGETQWLSVPKEIAGTLMMRGIENGSFDLQIEEVNGNDTVSETSFESIPSGAGTIVRMNIFLTQSTTASSTLSIDFDGNGSEDLALIAKENAVVLFDQTPPEAKISADPTTKDLKIEGVDESETTITKNGSNYVITDATGNITTLFFQKSYLGKLLTFAKLTGIQYGASAKIALPSSSFLYVWNPLANPPILLSQTIAVNDIYVIQATYDKKTNKTTVYLKKKGVQIQKQIFDGLRIPELTTSNGIIGYEL